jgi:hypothetical protein
MMAGGAPFGAVVGIGRMCAASKSSGLTMIGGLSQLLDRNSETCCLHGISLSNCRQ